MIAPQSDQIRFPVAPPAGSDGVEGSSSMTNPADGERRKVYRSRYLPGFMATVLLGEMIELPFLYYDHPHTLIHLAAAVLFISVFTGVVVYLYKVIVTPEGITAYTWHGFYRHYTWSEIDYVRQVKIPGFSYIRIIPRKGAVIWVPQFLKDWQEFREAVMAYVNDPGHPLVKYLTDRT